MKKMIYTGKGGIFFTELGDLLKALGYSDKEIEEAEKKWAQTLNEIDEKIQKRFDEIEKKAGHHSSGRL